jgi:hypothetical protein
MASIIVKRCGDCLFFLLDGPSQIAYISVLSNAEKEF